MNQPEGTAQGAERATRSLIEVPFYPVLMAAYLPLNLLAPNLAVFSPSQSIRFIFALALLGLALFTISYVAVRHLHNAALISAALIGTVWANLVNPSFDVPFLILALVILFVVWRTKLGHSATRIMNVFALAIFIQPAVLITTDYFRIQNNKDTALDYSPFYSSQLTVQPEIGAPNIVHIVLDGYASNDVLQNTFGFDNSGFVASLRSMGFKIGADVRTPHNQTVLALSTIFAGTHLDATQYPMTEPDTNRFRATLGRVASDGPLKNQLRKLNYSFLATESGYHFFSPADDDILTGPTFGFFSLNFFEKEMLERLLAILPQALTSIVGLDHFQASTFNAYLRHAMNSNLHRNQEYPFHYFIHMIAPHPPFVVDRHGETTDLWVEDFGTIND
ncbi:MAG: hypothetical protein ACR2P6_01190, partial [Gammaproteobacteria bacterium]